MKYNQITGLREEEFRRLTGVKKTTFSRRVDILREADQRKKSRGGRKNKLSIEDQLLMTLEYLREYRTYFHIGQRYEMSEGSAYKGIKWVEDTLIKPPDVALPGRKALLKSEIECEVVLMDATESPIERPKKSKGDTPLGIKKDLR